MSKLATVKDLNDSGPQLQIVASVRELQQLISLMQSDLSSLPAAVASELSSLGTLAESLDKALSAQRVALSAASRAATQATLEELREIASEQRQATVQLQKTTKTLQETAQALRGLSTLPKQMVAATDRLDESATHLSRNRTWQFALAMIGSAVLSATLTTGAVLLLVGMPDSKGPAQSAGQGQNSGSVWERLTESARER